MQYERQVCTCVRQVCTYQVSLIAHWYPYHVPCVDVVVFIQDVRLRSVLRCFGVMSALHLEAKTDRVFSTGLFLVCINRDNNDNNNRLLLTDYENG